MDSKQPLESKKFVSMLVGMVGVLVAGASAVAWGGALGLSALPYVIGGITAICGVHIGGQTIQDFTNAKNTSVEKSFNDETKK